ncbi:hypothetical protein ABTJ52_23475, partial [Acinetobacter baumannii]
GCVYSLWIDIVRMHHLQCCSNTQSSSAIVRHVIACILRRYEQEIVFRQYVHPVVRYLARGQ